ncbi:MAG: WGR domain-containing protein [Spirochaetia bacterium]
MIVTLYKTGKDGRQMYYTIHDRQGVFFDKNAFTAIWGRGIDTGREKYYTFDTRKDMDEKIRKLLKDKMKKGYKVLYSYFRKEKEKNEYENIIHAEIS